MFFLSSRALSNIWLFFMTFTVSLSVCFLFVVCPLSHFVTALPEGELRDVCCWFALSVSFADSSPKGRAKRTSLYISISILASPLGRGGKCKAFDGEGYPLFLLRYFTRRYTSSKPSMGAATAGVTINGSI